MEIVVLNSDIARLVLDYLKSQKLKKATHTFCKTSPYLKQEFSAYKRGLQTHSFFPELEEIICEYVKISRKVEQIMPKLADALRSQLQQCKLSEKVNELLERTLHSTSVFNVSANKNEPKNSVSSVIASQDSNTTDEKESTDTKRKRSFEISNNSSNDEVGTEIHKNERHKLISSRLGHCSKKRRVLQPYCFLSPKAVQRHRRRCYIKDTLTTDEDIAQREYEEELESSSEGGDCSTSDVDESSGNNNLVGDEIFDEDKPTTESTPQQKSNRKCELLAPIVPDISQAILDNPEFQQKLVKNINHALNKSSVAKSSTAKAQNSKETEYQNSPLKNSPVVGEVTSSQLLDQMIKNILDATEKEPSFDAIIQEVVEASNKPQVQSAAIQCNITPTNLPVVENTLLYTNSESPTLGPAHTVNQSQQCSAPVLPTTEQVSFTRTMTNVSPTNILPPRTPIILRSATGATSVNAAVTNGMGLSAHDQSNLLVNNAFGPLIDPNFSISKLIVLNSNDGGQKQIAENCIGNTTTDNLISQLTTSGVVDPNDEQVYLDTTTGQLTFPIFITNDGLLTNFPFLINNEFVNQQLHTNSIGNLEGSRIEIPAHEPIVVSANQLPPNSVVLSSVQKDNITGAVILSSDHKENINENSETVEKATKHFEIKPPTSLDNRLLIDKATPSSNGIVNTKAFKSMSTPRKRNSHVRTLTFSPRDPQSLNNAGTPLSSRKNSIFRFQRSLPKPLPQGNKVKTVESEIKQEEKSNTSEKAVIKTVEILPTIASSADGKSETLTETTNISTNETSNIPPLFVSEESSNQTIINKHLPALKETMKEPLEPQALLAPADQGDNTPKRKQFRKVATRSCRRQLAKSSNEDDLLAEKPEKENEKTTKSPQLSETRSTKSNMMDEWIQLRNSKVDLDVRLREINAQSSNQIKKVNTKKRARRKKPASIKKKEKELVKKAEELERSKELRTEVQNQTLNEKHDIEKSKELNYENKSCVDSHHTVQSKAEFLTTRNKYDNTTKQNTTKHDKTPKEYQNKAEEVLTQVENTLINAEVSTVSCPVPATNQNLPPHINEALEREKRTTNIAFLLETPFKDPNLASGNPPTPGIFAPSLETPAGKLKDPHDEMQASASFLFGSITKSELDTPLISAITPGFRFTPFGLKEVGTPKSLPGTDYSSGGGSYYKPDESEDLDRNIDKMLRNSAQKKTDSEAVNGSDYVEQSVDQVIEDQHEKEHCVRNEIDKIEIEIPIEKLKVEPIVLKRVKSFSTEAVDCIETAKIDPHYTLVSGLPEISAAEDECSSSSSSSKSSSSSSSSSSTSSSSTSSSSSNASVKSATVIDTAQSPKKVNINDLENLSDISSTEDEEWQKLAVTDNDENSQLVNNDGEVRYPVRSWLTPIKEYISIDSNTIARTEVTQTTELANHSTIKVTLPLKSAEKRNKQVKELELKKERIKEKLKTDTSTTIKKDKFTTSVTTAPNISAALAASRVLHAMRDKGKKTSCYQLPHSVETTTTEIPLLAQEKRSIDVLTALNLSAKKNLPKNSENLQKPALVLPTDHNDLSNSPTNLKGKVKTNISPSTINKTPQRKCLPIEARPVTRTIRKSGKKIVRTPLAFKVIHSPGKINSHSTTTTLAELAATKTLNKKMETASPFVQQTLRVSPRLMKPSQVRGKKQPESATSKATATKKNVRGRTTAVAKSKVTRLRNYKKMESTQALLEKPMKEDISKDRKKEYFERKNDEEIEDETQQNSAAALKPKIHLKARNAMISTKQKTIAKKEELAAERKLLAEQLTSEQQHHIKSAPPNICVSPQTINADPTISITEGDNWTEDDPLDDCEMTTIDETDTTRFIQYTYNGPENLPTVVSKPHDFSNFQMVVAIDENEKHIWRITEGTCLFSCAPSLPKTDETPATISKKRKLRATFATTSNSKIAPAVATTSAKTTGLRAFSTNNPSATSTPVAIQTSASRSIARSGKINGLTEEEASTTKAAAKPQSVETNKKTSPAPSNETPKIQIEDIESILSHLHGT